LGFVQKISNGYIPGQLSLSIKTKKKRESWGIGKMFRKKSSDVSGKKIIDMPWDVIIIVIEYFNCSERLLWLLFNLKPEFKQWVLENKFCTRNILFKIKNENSYGFDCYGRCLCFKHIVHKLKATQLVYDKLKNFSNLQYLNLRQNKIAEIKNLDKLTQLKILHLSDNKITRIEGLNKLAQLQKLNVSCNKITKIEGLDKLTQLQKLVLWDNKVTKIEGLDKLTQLQKLNLSFNTITKIEGLDKLIQLQKLNLYHNEITKATIDTYKTKHNVKMILTYF